MVLRQVTIPATDGFSLEATVYEPEACRGGRHVLLAAGTGVKRRFYDRYARFLCQQGFAVVTFDYRGIGGSRPASLPAFQATMRDWGEKDLAGVIEWVCANPACTKLLVVGHSVGGQLLGLAPNNAKVKAMVAVAVQSGYWGHWPGLAKFRMAGLWYFLMPGLTRIRGYFPAKRLRVGEDLPRGVALEWARWGRNRNYMVDENGVPLRSGFESFRSPILYFSFDDDAYAPKRAVEWMLGWYGSPSRVGHHVQPGDLGTRSIGHFGFFRELFKESLWQESSDWLGRQ